eukprot:1948071-Amphidinium_carterae.1
MTVLNFGMHNLRTPRRLKKVSKGVKKIHGAFRAQHQRTTESEHSQAPPLKTNHSQPPGPVHNFESTEDIDARKRLLERSARSRL